MTDQLAAWCTLAAVVAAFLTLFFTYKEIRKAVNIRLAERAESLMAMMIDIEQVAVEHPDLAPYIFDGEPLPSDPGTHRDGILAYALLFVDFAETVGWQIRTGEMSADAAHEWHVYFEEMHDRSEAIRAVYERDEKVYAVETKWLLGVSEPPETVERLSRKGRHPRLQLRLDRRA